MQIADAVRVDGVVGAKESSDSEASAPYREPPAERPFLKALAIVGL